MKKSLIALAALASLAAAGTASAQSSVTLFGIVDVNYAHYSVGNGGGHVNVLTNSGYNSSRLGFRGTEDLGGGLAASFWLEGALNPDNGNASGLTFQRRSTVSLSGNWGEVRLGRDYTPTFWNMTVFDPYGTNGVGTQIGWKARTSSAVGGTVTSASTATPLAVVNGATIGANDATAVRSDNMVQYFLPPNLGGFYGQISYAFDEKASSDAGQYYGGRLGWASGPFNVAAAFGHTKGGQVSAASGTTPASVIPKVTDWNLGGQWDFGMAKLLANYDHAKYGDSPAAGPNGTIKSWLIGGLIPVGPGEIRLSYSAYKLDNTGFNTPKADQWAIGYDHNLSKRTALYATVARLKNKDGSALAINNSLPQATSLAGVANASSTGFDIGIRHSF